MRKTKKTEDHSLKDFLDALDEIQRTKGIDKEELISAVEAALISAYKKDYKGGQNVRVEINRETGVMKVYAQKNVVEEVENDLTDITLAEAKAISPAYELGDIVEFELDPKDFGRVAAQNAKQLILQRIKEAERNMIFETYLEKKDELITGIVSRIEKNDVYIEMGRYEGVMNYANQIPTEQYFSGMRLRVYIADVVKTNKGPQIVLSRSHPALIKRLFEFEIPEIYDGTVEIMSISREAGSRTKIAVCAKDGEIDAVGACVGHKGTRIQNILNEIGGERIDVVEYSENPVVYIKNALNPATALEVIVDEDGRSALVVVDDSQLSLAIGKDGQNVRLAARLTGFKIDIKNPQQYEELLRQRELQAEEAAAEAAKLEEGAADILIEEEEMLFDAEELDAAQSGQLSEDIREVGPEESEE
mgnify:CR=1 FL=1